MSKLRFGSFSVALFLVLLLCAVNSFAQAGGTTVRGTVQDPNGNLVKGATVTLTDPSKNFTRTQQTNEDGQYVFSAVPPGTYRLEVTAQGFKTASASGVQALVDTPTVRDVPLEIGAVSETVDVTSAAETQAVELIRHGIGRAHRDRLGAGASDRVEILIARDDAAGRVMAAQGDCDAGSHPCPWYSV